MDDQQTVALLELLAEYAEEYGNGGDPHMGIGDLVGDLVDSLPRDLEPRKARETLDRTFWRRALS